GSDVTALGVPSGAERRRGAWTGQRAGGEEAEAEAGQGEPAAVGVEPELRAAVAAPGVEGAVGAVVAGDGGPEVVGAVPVGRLVGVLGVVAGAGEVVAEHASASAASPRRASSIGTPLCRATHAVFPAPRLPRCGSSTAWTYSP